MKKHQNTTSQTSPDDTSIKARIALAAGLFQSDITIHTLIESFAEAFLVIDEEARVILVNQRFVDLFGHEQNELVGKPMDTILPERFRHAHTNHVRKYFKSPHIRPMGRGLELKGMKKNGTEIPVEVSISYLETQNGKMGLAFITDISARSEAEEALQKQNRALASFAQTVAHDLKSLITSITGFSDLLEEEFENLSPEDRQQSLGMVKEAGYKMNDIINELLFLARVRREDVVLKPIDIDEAISEAINRLRWKIHSCQADVVVNESCSDVMGYQPWIEEAVYNLLSNALSHGGENLTVKVSMEPTGDDYVRVKIVDNGQGMTEEQINLLQEQPEELSYGWVKGHGLGLSIVHQILGKLGSSLEVACEKDKGCMFAFLLPVNRE